MIPQPRWKERPAISDVAREAGVSTASISRFLNPRKRMELTRPTRAKIERAIEKLSYLPSPFARRRRAKETYTFGLLTSLSKDIFHSRYHTELLSGVFDRIGRTSHSLKFFLLKDRHYERLEEILYEQGIDGLLILTWRIHPNMVRLVEKTSGELPLVVFNDFDPRLKANILYTDVREGIRQAVIYLLEKGYQKIGMLAGPSEIIFQEGKRKLRVPSIDAKEKTAGFLEALREKRVPVREAWLRKCASYREGDGYHEMKLWVGEAKGRKLPEALVAGNDEIALGALRALKEAKLSVPGKMALVGFDDIEKAKLISPALTTVRQSLYQMGLDAVDILIERVEFPVKEPVQKRYAPELVIRETA